MFVFAIIGRVNHKKRPRGGFHSSVWMAFFALSLVFVGGSLIVGTTPFVYRRTGIGSISCLFSLLIA